MKVFISSVRRGLEEERDSLPALIKAVGHVPRRFEDFTAQPSASRDACLAGVEDADVYLLLLGPHYGDPLPDSGQAPTEEEWTVARRRGISIVVFRKAGVDLEAAQAEFARRVEDYVTGRFRGTFTSATDLLPKVAQVLRDLEEEPTALVWTPLDVPMSPEWVVTDQQLGYGGSGATVEVHLMPVDVRGRVGVMELERFAERLARLGREHGVFGAADALDLRSDENSAVAARRSGRDVRAAGVTVGRAGAAAAWEELPRDGLGTILDRADLAERVAQLCRLASELIPRQVNNVAIAVGLGPTQTISEGDIRDLGRRNSATMGMNNRLIRLDAEESVPADALGRAADEVAAELATRIVMRFRHR